MSLGQVGGGGGEGGAGVSKEDAGLASSETSDELQAPLQTSAPPPSPGAPTEPQATWRRYPLTEQEAQQMLRLRLLLTGPPSRGDIGGSRARVGEAAGVPAPRSRT